MEKDKEIAKGRKKERKGGACYVHWSRKCAISASLVIYTAYFISEATDIHIVYLTMYTNHVPYTHPFCTYFIGEFWFIWKQSL